MDFEIRLYLDQIGAKSPAHALDRDVVRVMYVVDGALAVCKENGTLGTLGANSAIHQSGDWAISGGSVPTTVLRWEVVDAARPTPLAALSDVSSTLLLAAPALLRSDIEYLVRCDRVDFPPGGEALLHTHQGCGTRCLVSGSIRIDTQGASHVYGPLQAWFENGTDPVFAAADSQQPSAFVRVMILPRALLGGKSSIKYVRAEDLDRPKSQRYQIFVDTPIELPRQAA